MKPDEFLARWAPCKAVIELPADEWQISLIETQCGMAFAERNI